MFLCGKIYCITKTNIIRNFEMDQDILIKCYTVKAKIFPNIYRG